MPGNAFVYGTLMADEVVRLLIKRVPHSRAATLPGFSRHKIKGVVYPAIVPSEGTGARVQGKVLMDLSDKELHILDVYEAEEYYRSTVEPELEDGSRVSADVYIWKDEFRDMLLLQEGDWGYELFRSQHLPSYLDMTAEFMREMEGQLQQ